MDENRARRREAPPYGSFESAPFGHDFKLSEADKRKAKRSVIEAWPGP